jgi:aspartyl-tRNA(Asn)/glutamyl-tRNA(Gln) amidotransferase subunit C
MASVVATTLPLRDDRVSDGDCRDAILGNAPRAEPGGRDRGFFVVPKVVG